jgi:hypothetical protein
VVLAERLSGPISQLRKSRKHIAVHVVILFQAAPPPVDFEHLADTNDRRDRAVDAAQSKN